MEKKKIETQKIAPCLWFNDNGEEAANFYVSIFQNSKIGKVSRYGKNAPLPEGTALTVAFELEGQSFLALNGGPVFKFTEAVSFVVNCETQKEIDEFWKKLSAGGQEQQCGWLKDKYGLSWQIVPTKLGQLLDGKDPEKAGRVMQALMKMVKLDLDVLEKAYHGTAVMN
jgi:predicted 3-demethylubiquinone-9 3-methyltransferase (glyoxalase superfamily)